MKQVLVAGCGAAGMMAAITAARRGATVTLLEGMEKPGKKLLTTGNGRCNLTNLDPVLPNKYRSVSLEENELSEWLKESFSRFSVSDTLDFFHELGLLTIQKDGYVYPATGQAGSVLDLLMAELRRWNVKLKLKEKIVRIKKQGEGWKVQTEGWTYTCDSLILCCGSKAASHTGSDGSGYQLAQQAGHSLTLVVPALTALTGKDRAFSVCAGVRCPARVTLFSMENENWTIADSDCGELQWTEKGISGIVVFQISRTASLLLKEQRAVRAVLDLLPQTEGSCLAELLNRQRLQYPKSSVGDGFSGILPKKLLQACLERMGQKPGTAMERWTEEHCRKLAEVIKEFSLEITGTRSFDQCQVCAGGIRLSEVSSKTLESKKAPGLYLAGEILDVDGPCGGYNLQWAWSSGYLAGWHCCGGKEEQRAAD